MTTHRVFISYTHDSPEHADRVLHLSDKLRSEGIDCILDQYETSPSVGWPRWMDRNIRSADFVLMVCTETYFKRVMGEEKPGKGLGVRWEGKLIYQHLYNDDANQRFIPILFEENTPAQIPTPFQDATYYYPSTPDGYEKLYRRITNQPYTTKPKLGKPKSLLPRERKQDFLDPKISSDKRPSTSPNLFGRKISLGKKAAYIVGTFTLITALLGGGGGLLKAWIESQPTLPPTTEDTPQPSEAVVQNGADRLADLQNDDGGWDWPLGDGNPVIGSQPSTVGPIAKGLAEAYEYTGDPDHLAALQAAGTFLLAKKNNFSPPDGYLAAALDEIFGGSSYTDHVLTNFYDPLAAGTYNRNGTGTLYDTAGYVNWLRTEQACRGNPNLAAWDIGMGLAGAASVGADTSAWIAGVKAEIDELDGRDDYDVIGLAGAIYGLAYVGEDYDPVAGAHASAGGLADLGRVLAGYQLATGGFTSNSYFLEEEQDNEDIQVTVYAILALAELDRTTYLSAIQAAADYIARVQLGMGGWERWAGGGENNWYTGEALWGIATARDDQRPL
ncbi:MAG: TIR domain-containing protein [Chloroflexota bacterium]